MAGRGRWGYQRLLIASPRWWSNEYLEPLVEPVFHEDSYGYRPGKSALDAVGVARQRCWRQGWVLDLDIKAFFDNIDWSLLMRAVRKHTRCPWVLMYIERWLKAPAQMADGSLIVRERGTPQGGVISPMLANLFLHYAFDTWMTRDHPGIRFERYADDAICHCTSEAEASALRRSLEGRFAECGLTLHPEKTKIVYCKDDDRRGTYPDQKFDFLGYTFRPRLSRRRRNTFGVSFSPAASDKALKAIRQTVRSWTLHERSDKTLDDLARMFNASIRGWINYYGSSTSRRFTRPYGTSIAYWHDGRIGSSSPSDVTGGERSSGWLASRDANRCCLLTGGCCRGMAERWEPDEARVSRPVLRAPGGETPPGDSPRHPQPRSCGRGSGVDAAGHDQARPHHERSEDHRARCAAGALRFSGL